MSEPSTATGKPYGFCLPARVAVIAAHPDDEVLWLGGQLRHIPKLTLIHVTDGSPRDLGDARRAGFDSREQYTQARARELERALGIVGVRDARRIALGAVDQEAVLQLPKLVTALAHEITDVDAVITHPYEGGHPDHDACACAVQLACSLLVRSGKRAPKRLEFPSYHARGREAAAGVFWTNEAYPEQVIPLGAEDVRRKRVALEAYVTQQPVLPHFPLDVERIRTAPEYDFTQPPPPRTVLYDRFNWPLNSERWRAKAREASASVS